MSLISLADRPWSAKLPSHHFSPPAVKSAFRGDGPAPTTRWERSSWMIDVVAPGDDVSDAWEARAEQWLAWARTPGQDIYFWQLNWPAFRELLPPAGRRTLDIGCGEGRVGRELARAGHRVLGVDSSPTLAALAREAGGYEEVAAARANALPWPAECCDLAIAFMSLQDMENPAAAIAEIARVLQRSGRLCLAIIHPLNRPPEGLEDYFSERRVATRVTHAGLEMTCESIDRPFQTYTRALASAGFVIEDLREPQATLVQATEETSLAEAARRPYFVHMRCRLDGHR